MRRLVAAACLLAPGTAPAGALESAIDTAADGQWLAYRTPIVEGAGSPCCLDHADNGKACRLDANDWTDRRDARPETTLHVYLEVRDGRVVRLRPYGAQCPVDPPAEGVRWINRVAPGDALSLLTGVARGADARAASSAAATLALHQEPAATEGLDTLLRDASEPVARDAALWLALRRGENGFDRVQARFESGAAPALRQHLVFCLSQSPSPRSGRLLQDIAAHDRDPAVRGDALLWLAHAGGASARAFIERIARADPEEDTQRRAVFALSQLPDGEGVDALDAMVADPAAPRVLRREALFWLVQSDDHAADRRLKELLDAP